MSDERWFVVDHEHDDVKLRGPFEHSEAAAAVRREMERTTWRNFGNLWIVSEAGE